MSDSTRTEADLVDEISVLKKKIRELERIQEDQKRIEADLRLSHERLRLLIDGGPDFFFLKDGELRYRLVNRANAAFFGCEEADILGRTDMDLMPEGAAQACRESDRLALREMRGVATVEPVGDRFYDIRKFPVTVAGEPVGVAGIIRDVTDLKRAQEALRQSEERQKTILGNLGAYVFLKDTHCRYTYVNNMVCTLFGRGEAEIIGRGDESFFSPASVEEIMKSDRRVIERGETIAREETDLTSSDGLPRTYWVVKLPLRDHSGNITGLCGISTDITEHRRAEEALQQSEELYRTVVEQTHDGIYIYKGNRLVFVNSRMSEITGYTKDELRTMNFWNIVHPADREYVMDIGRRRDQGEEVPATYEARAITKDGKVLHLELAVSRIAYEGEYAVIGAVRDVTARKEAEGALRRIAEELQESEERYRTAIESSNDAITMIKNGRHFHVNRKFLEIFGFDRVEQVLGRPAGSFTHPDDRERIISIQRQRQRNEEAPGYYEFKGITTGGDVIFIEASVTTTIYKGEPLTLAYLRDITVRKHLENQLRQSQKMEAIGTLAGGVAHDLNNILTVLMGYGSLLDMGLDRDSPLRAYADQILASSRNAANLTQSLLTFSRQQPAVLSAVRLNETVKKTEGLLARLLTEDITLKTSLSVEDMTILADATQIDQILFNLATNARDAMARGGILSIRTVLGRIDRDFIETHGYGQTGEYACLIVSDTGTGMDRLTREKIFDPFFTTKEVGKGTGLGLSTVYGIVKQHKGYIDVKSEPGEGTTFTVYFPVASVTVREEQPASPALGKGNETILVAEDNEEVRRFLREILGRYGYTVIEAVDGEDAVAKFRRQERIDLIIVDSVMPRKNGRDVYNEITGMDGTVKVLFTSGHTRDVVLDKGIRESEFNFIPKPISPDDLLRKVREVLDKT